MEKRIVIITSCTEGWGGSEELWAKSIPFLMANGIHVSVIKPDLPMDHLEFVKLRQSGVKLVNLRFVDSRIRRVSQKLLKMVGAGRKDLSLPGFVQAPVIRSLKRKLKAIAPSLVVISQGINFDGLGYAYACMALGYPYVVVAQKAVDFYWPLPDDRRLMKVILEKARRCYFVSHHNKRLTEEQFALKLPQGEVISNPVKVRGEIPFPPVTAGFRLCCVARLFLLDKGQDMLIRVLSQQKWQDRPLHISFIGKGVDDEALKELTQFLRVANVSFLGHLSNAGEVWKDYHALILPSRSEGLPLTIMEAMMAGRVIITTTAGGNAELLEEGVTGFLAEVTEKSLDEAMERAWQERHRWEAMGRKANEHITQHVPQQPERIFAEKLLQII